MPLPTVTYCLRMDPPLEVDFADGWSLELTHCAQGVFCYFQEEAGSTGERFVCSGETEEWVMHQLRVIGVEVPANSVLARLFERMIAQGHAERLPEPRSWRDHPYPQTAPILFPLTRRDRPSRLRVPSAAVATAGAFA